VVLNQYVPYCSNRIVGTGTGFRRTIDLTITLPGAYRLYYASISTRDINAGRKERPQPAPRYRFQPSLTQCRFPSSPSRITNFSHRPSRPEPTTSMVRSLGQPRTPFDGRANDVPKGGTWSDPGGDSSPISKWALAKEYTSENTRGSNGILPKIPHFWFVPSSDGEEGDWLRRD
jgi:hypothetical protein